MKVYLSSPYEHDRANARWKTRVTRFMQKCLDDRVTVIDPCPDACDEKPLIDEMKANEDWLGMYSFCANIVEGDLAMLNSCQGMIAYLPYGAKTFGTTHEIIHALQNQIPIVLVMPEGIDKVSHWLWGILGPNRIFDNLEEAAATLVRRMQVIRGEKLNDSVHYPRGSKASR
jgi:hypothetical protein